MIVLGLIRRAYSCQRVTGSRSDFPCATPPALLLLVCERRGERVGRGN